MLTYNFIWNCTPKMEMWVKSVKSESAWQHIFWDNLMFSVQLLTCKRVESIQKKMKSAPLSATVLQGFHQFPRPFKSPSTPSPHVVGWLGFPLMDCDNPQYIG